MIHLKQSTIEDKELVFVDTDHNYLGPGLVLKRCHLILRTSARALTVTGVELLNCHIDANKKLVNFQMWCGAVIKDCTFTGLFVGNDFGHWHAQNANGGIESCSFSKAVLDGCRFMDCNVNSLQLPGWPCFTVLSPHGMTLPDDVTWPGKLKAWAMDLAKQPRVAAALVGYAPSLGKRFDCTENELRETLPKLRNVRF